MKSEKISHLDINVTHFLSDKSCIERRGPQSERYIRSVYLQEYGKKAN